MTNGHNGDRPRAASARGTAEPAVDRTSLDGSPEAMRRFRRVAANFATGVAVVTSVADDVPVGMTVNSFATVSLEPTLVLVCLRHGSRLLSSIEHSGVFAATVLAAQQQRQAQWFANPARPTGAAAFAGIATRHAPTTGCLLLSEGLAYFDCRVRDRLPAGDHAVVLGEVAAYNELWPREPLLFVDGSYVAVERRLTDPAQVPARDDPVAVLSRQRLGHWAAPVAPAVSGEAAAAVPRGSAAVSADADAGLSTSATAWAVTTRR
jgi:flavin reductase (DIM6/NTAB) family NADH-FMN oxidoreductase RutF